MIDEKKLIEELFNKMPHTFGAPAIDWFRDLIESQPKIGVWIPCSERLPEEERFYIVTYKFDDEENYKCHELYYGVADGENDAGWYIDDDCERLYKPFTVIAWQPLPEAYHG